MIHGRVCLSRRQVVVRKDMIIEIGGANADAQIADADMGTVRGEKIL